MTYTAHEPLKATHCVRKRAYETASRAPSEAIMATAERQVRGTPYTDGGCAKCALTPVSTSHAITKVECPGAGL